MQIAPAVRPTLRGEEPCKHLFEAFIWGAKQWPWWD
jgi:hypothetical protein